MTTNPTRTPAEVFHPGVHLQEELDARGWTRWGLAYSTGIPFLTVIDLIEGTIDLTPSVAAQIAAAFGQNTSFWLNLQETWDAAQSERG